MEAHPDVPRHRSHFGLALTLTYRKAESKNNKLAEKGIKHLKTTIEAGYSPARLALARAHVARGDLELALQVYQSAADDGDAQAIAELGFLYFDEGVPDQDDLKAVQYFERAAEQGHFLGHWGLAKAYEDGRGVRKNLEEAFLHWLIVAENADSHHQSIARDRLAKIGRVLSVAVVAKLYRTTVRSLKAAIVPAE